ncbi:hypothetical protein LR48_Vigan02g075200 [Vigna angularis]|uniref:Uncharacterized protein n=1 Tax=Phaseolus angularis TaxID=3914 RepID=A0A0L9TW24_PHAAN|nr:hypothetical protein LR48_Vigan02g075200 [Vigna angularis]
MHQTTSFHLISSQTTFRPQNGSVPLKPNIQPVAQSSINSSGLLLKSASAPNGNNAQQRPILLQSTSASACCSNNGPKLRPNSPSVAEAEMPSAAVPTQSTFQQRSRAFSSNQQRQRPNK